MLIRHLSSLGYPIKLLIRPSKVTPNLPKGLPLDVAVAGFNDEKGLRAAMKDVNVIFHLAGAETQGRLAQLTEVDIKGTQALVHAAAQARIDRFFYLSHLGADRASAFPLFKAKSQLRNIISAIRVFPTLSSVQDWYMGKGIISPPAWRC